MERQRIKILFLYFGQPRMVKECIPWHDHAIKYLKSLEDYDIQIDLDYHLWNQYYDKIVELSNQNLSYNNWKQLKNINCDEVKNTILNNRVEGCKVSCNFYSYDIVEQLHEMLNCGINKDLFFGFYSQTILKALACKNIPDDYDIVFLTRTDLINNPNYYTDVKEDFKNFFIKYYKKISGKKKDRLNNRLIHILWLNYLHKSGIQADDRCLLGQPKSLKEFFSDYEKKIRSYIQNIGIYNANPHHIWINLGLFYLRDITKKDEIDEDSIWFREYPVRSDFTIAYRIDSVLENINDINEESFLKIKTLSDDYKTDIDKKRNIDLDKGLHR